MVQKDNEAACVGLVQLGAAVKVSTVAPPTLEMGNYPSMTVAGDTDGLTLSLEDVGSTKSYLDIHTAIKANSTPEITKEILASVCSLIISSMGATAWTDFKIALDMMEPGSVASKDVVSANHWIVARAHGQWNTGGAMTPGERSQWIACDTPFKY